MRPTRAVMEEAIRDIDGAIDEVRTKLGRVVVSKHLANQRLTDESRKHEELTEKIEVAVKEGRDDLAEVAIARQLDIEAQIPVLETTISDCGKQERELEGYITALQAKKREMREELRQFRESRQESFGADAGAAGGAAHVSVGNVASDVSKAESAFERVLERTTGLTGPAVPSGGDAAKLAELDELVRTDRIQERLAVIKSKSKTE